MITIFRRRNCRDFKSLGKCRVDNCLVCKDFVEKARERERERERERVIRVGKRFSLVLGSTV